MTEQLKVFLMQYPELRELFNQDNLLHNGLLSGEDLMTAIATTLIAFSIENTSLKYTLTQRYINEPHRIIVSKEKFDELKE